MKIRDVMTEAVKAIKPTDTIVDAARAMGEFDVGALPVIEGEKLVGMVTDRDIAVRGVAGGMHSGSPVLNVMTKDVRTCRADDDIEDVLSEMADEQIRRVPVCSDDGRLVGIVSIGDAARYDRDREEVAETLGDICSPHGAHSQTLAEV